MTEDEAKTKWCPHSRNFRAIERPLTDADTRCIASACMAWREITTLHAFDKSTGEDLGYLHVVCMVTQEWRRVPTGGGYCGFAGAPQ